MKSHILDCRLLSSGFYFAFLGEVLNENHIDEIVEDWDEDQDGEEPESVSVDVKAFLEEKEGENDGQLGQEVRSSVARHHVEDEEDQEQNLDAWYPFDLPET